MVWQKTPTELVELYERVRPPAGAGVEHRKMFGCPCCFVNGQMFMGLFEDRLFLRLGEDDRAAFLALPGAEQFTPMDGRPMREYVTAPAAMLADGPELRGWIDRSLTYAAALPAKERKPRTAARAKRAVA